MTPREFDASVVQARLRLIDGLLEDLRTIGELTPDRLSDDRILRHAVERILMQVVELAVSINNHVASSHHGKVPADYRSSFDAAANAGAVPQALSDRLKPSVDLRNVVAHDYVDIDLSVVAAAADLALVDYRDYVGAVAGWLRTL